MNPDPQDIKFDWLMLFVWLGLLAFCSLSIIGIAYFVRMVL